MRVSDDAGGRSPYYSLTIQPPMPIDSGITANIQGFELRDTGLALSVDTDFNFDARLQGRLLIPYSLQDGAPTEVGFQADVNNEGLHAELFTEIGTDALMTRKDAVPAVGAISVDINQNQGGMVIFDYQSVDRFKFAGLEITTEHGTRWVIGQYEIVETGDPNDNIESREPRWTVLASAAADELFGAPDTVTMRVQWDGGHVQVGRYTAANDSFEMQADYQFLTSFSGGLAGLGSPAQTAQPSWFANYRVWASGTTPTQFVQVYHDPLNSTPAAPWQVERGVWQPADSGLQGAPTEIHLGDWLLVARARLATELDVRFDPTDILAAPTSIAASIGVSNLDALIYEVDDGGTPLYPNDPNSPLGLVAVQDGFGELSTAGISLGAARFSAGIKDVVFIEIYDGKIDLADGPYLLEAGGVGITIPFFGDEPFDIQDANPDDGIPLFGLEKPEVSGGDLVKAAAFFFGQAVGFDLPVGQATDQFSLRDLLPLTVENVHLEFPDTNQLDTFTLAVDAQFNLYERDADGNIIIENGQPKRRGIFSALPFDPILAIGRPAASGCSTGTAIDWPELDSAEYPDIQGLTLCENGFVSAEVEADSLLSPNRQLMFKQLGPIFIGAREFPVLGVDNVAADGALYLGKIVDGQWDGNVAATFTLKDTTEANNNQVRASAVGQIVVTEGSDTGTTFTDTKLDLDWVVEASADTSWFGISDGYANFHTVLTNRTTPDIPFNLAFTSTIGPFDTGLIEIPLGDYFTLFGRAKVNPDAGPDEPFFILRQAGVTVNEAAPDTLKGLTFEAGGFGVSADFGHYFVLAAEPEDDPSTVDYDESIGAYFRVAIDDESGVPGGNIFGLPEWFPIQVTEVGIRFKGTDGTGDDLDVTLDQLGSNPTQPFLELANPANYRLIISGGLESSDAWPIRAQIKNLEIVISDLQKFIGEPCYTQPAKWGSDVCPLPFDVSSVNGISAGIDPFELGPVSIGGGFSLGVQDVVFDNGDHRQVLYAQVLGELSVADVGIGAELIITQYGPVLARLKSAVPVPIAGIIGAAVGSAFFGVGAAAGFQIGNQTGFVITGLEGALVFDAPSIDEIPNPLDILDRPEFAHLKTCRHKKSPVRSRASSSRTKKTPPPPILGIRGFVWLPAEC